MLLRITWDSASPGEGGEENGVARLLPAVFLNAWAVHSMLHRALRSSLSWRRSIEDAESTEASLERRPESRYEASA
jgi:hypothetical protein